LTTLWTLYVAAITLPGMLRDHAGRDILKLGRSATQDERNRRGESAKMPISRTTAL
jgi:hypothetical protein